VCTAANGSRLCSAYELCAAHRPGDKGGEFAVAARGGPDGGTLYWISVLSLGHPSEIFGVQTDLAGVYQMFSGTIKLQVNPQLGRYTVVINNPFAVVGDSHFLPPPIIFS
jgi:hypothetical protein